MPERADENQTDQMDEGRRNSDIREETNVRDALGDLSIGNETEKVTPENDLFKDDLPKGNRVKAEKKKSA